eukprot:Lithocolla_globosa_v1_NODE_210_length_5154_cov_15.452834.p2 type:complete len:351 gc:universal NODE_210_length_5154_cov_15.452834:4250-3198(-)
MSTCQELTATKIHHTRPPHNSPKKSDLSNARPTETCSSPSSSDNHSFTYHSGDLAFTCSPGCNKPCNSLDELKRHQRVCSSAAFGSGPSANNNWLTTAVQGLSSSRSPWSSTRDGETTEQRSNLGGVTRRRSQESDEDLYREFLEFKKFKASARGSDIAETQTTTRPDLATERQLQSQDTTGAHSWIRHGQPNPASQQLPQAATENVPMRRQPLARTSLDNRNTHRHATTTSSDLPYSGTLLPPLPWPVVQGGTGEPQSLLSDYEKAIPYHTIPYQRADHSRGIRATQARIQLPCGVTTAWWYLEDRHKKQEATLEGGERGTLSRRSPKVNKPTRPKTLQSQLPSSVRSG